MRLSACTSTRTGRAPACSMTLMLEAKVIGVPTTAVPAPIPRASRETWRAAVPELTASAAGAPTHSAADRRLISDPVMLRGAACIIG